ncbi:MAG TPA: SIS domain-containing protein [Pyrinomonadaceae bacterium]|nr:SIS domain-containing protein [Pyrinomonadaceae bacterium]
MNQKLENLTFSELLDLPVEEKEKYGLVHTTQEIFQQPETWKGTFQIVKNREVELQSFLRNSGLSNANLSVVLIGAGTSDYIGRALTAILKKEWKCQVQAIPSTDLLTEMDNFIDSAPTETKHLWISFSRSGDSFEGVKVLEKAVEKYPKIRHLIVTCNQDGKMASQIYQANPNYFCLVLDKKVNDLGLAMTSSFTNMVVAGQCLAHIFALDNYESILQNLTRTGAENFSKIADVAQTISQNVYQRICFLGSGALKAVADESALKVLELSGGYFSVMSESFLGLRHGPLSWLNQDSLVVGFVSNGPEKQKIELGLLAELKRKDTVKHILAILPNELFNVSGIADFAINLNISNNLTDFYCPPIEILFAQILGLFSSLHQSLHPDSPSKDGKIKRVVSEINVD